MVFTLHLLEWYTLESRQGKKDRVSGSLHLIFYYSIFRVKIKKLWDLRNKETRVSQLNEHAFYYEPYLNMFKTGMR
jgi:hypothetical protein